MIAVSVVISAPKGLNHCLGLETFLAGVAAGQLELIVADGTADAPEHRHPALRHVRRPGASVFELRRAGLQQAGKEWVLLTEDHCRPLPGLLEAYGAALRRYPDADLFSGALTNDTSTSPWAWASFLLFRHEFWPPAGKTPGQAAIGNLLVRRTAILDGELNAAGGFDYTAIRRLARSGRYVHCREAVMDHVEPIDRREALVSQFHSARATASLTRRVAPYRWQTLVLRLFAVPLNRVLVVPARVFRDVRATPQGRWPVLPRLMAIGFASAAGWLLGTLVGPGTSVEKVG
jgi:hypothetical protein